MGLATSSLLGLSRRKAGSQGKEKAAASRRPEVSSHYPVMLRIAVRWTEPPDLTRHPPSLRYVANADEINARNQRDAGKLRGHSAHSCCGPLTRPSFSDTRGR